MLTRIHLQNFAISTSVEVDLDSGMTVLTGETGAGKSILVDALNLVLGDRADTGVVRHGSERASIHASFNLSENSPALSWLKSQELDDGEECQLRRVIFAEGRSKAYINDTPVNLSSLKTLGEMLIDIHGQHEHQALMIPARQRELLDNSGDYQNLINQVAELGNSIRQTRKQLAEMQQGNNDNQAQLELLRYQLQELENAGVPDLDITALLSRHEEASNADTLIQLCASTIHALKENDDSAISSQIGRLANQLDHWRDTNQEIADACQILLDSLALIDEAAHSLSPLQERLEIDPQELKQMDSQVAVLHDLSRKHGVKPETLADTHREKASQLQQIDQHGTDLSELQALLTANQEKYISVARQLHEARIKQAGMLSQKVTEQMQLLGMQGGQFEIGVNSIDHEDHYGPHGSDNIQFLVSANPGQPLKPLQKVASGGELSRISLAITVICANQQSTPTMIFDEVDSGIGGAVADIVGKQLRQLGDSVQVLCVTHLPQVAASGHHHFRVVKTSSDQHTESRVLPLDEDNRIQEIARMLGGSQLTENSLAHARELLSADRSALAS